MLPEIDIFRSANLLIRQHGLRAEDAARDRAYALIARHDFDGFTVWMRIAAAIATLQQPPPDGERLN